MSVFFPKSLNDWKSKPKDDDASIGSKTQVTVDELNKINGMNAKNLTTNALVTGYLSFYRKPILQYIRQLYEIMTR